MPFRLIFSNEQLDALVSYFCEGTPKHLLLGQHSNVNEYQSISEFVNALVFYDDILTEDGWTGDFLTNEDACTIDFSLSKIKN